MEQNNITVNGAPVSEYIDKEIGIEIGQVRHSDAAIKVRRPIVSKSIRNPSGSRTAPGVVVYQAGQRETHVIVAGNMFPWQDKAPYVLSGHSTLGAIEYDEKTDEVKCHSCGQWTESIGYHVLRKRLTGSSVHGTMRDYRIRHGFRMQHSPLSTPGMAEHRKNLIKPNTGHFRKGHDKISNGAILRRDVILARRSLDIAPCAETANLTNSCKAQKLSLLKSFAEHLGHTPTDRELKDYEVNGSKPLWPTGLTKLFRVSMSHIFIQASIPPRAKGVRMVGTSLVGGRRRAAHAG